MGARNSGQTKHFHFFGFYALLREGALAHLCQRISLPAFLFTREAFLKPTTAASPCLIPLLPANAASPFHWKLLPSETSGHWVHFHYVTCIQYSLWFHLVSSPIPWNVYFWVLCFIFQVVDKWNPSGWCCGYGSPTVLAIRLKHLPLCYIKSQMQI